LVRLEVKEGFQNRVVTGGKSNSKAQESEYYRSENTGTTSNTYRRIKMQYNKEKNMEISLFYKSTSE